MIRFIAKIILSDNSEYTVYADNIVNIEFDNMSVKDISQISFGIVSSSGRLEFIDIEKTFYKDINKRIIKNSTVKIYLTEEFYSTYSTGLPKDDVCATFYVESFDYNEESLKLTLNLIDGLIYWQDVIIRNDFLTLNSMNLDDIISYIMKYNDTPTKIIDINSVLKGNLQSKTVFIPHIKQKSIWHHMDKVCEASLCNIYTDESGNAVIAKEKTGHQDSIIIRPSQIFNISDKIYKYDKSIWGCIVDEIVRAKEGGTIVSGINAEIHSMEALETDYTDGYTSVKELASNAFYSRSRSNQTIKVHEGIEGYYNGYVYFNITVNSTNNVFFTDTPEEDISLWVGFDVQTGLKESETEVLPPAPLSPTTMKWETLTVNSVDITDSKNFVVNASRQVATFDNIDNYIILTGNFSVLGWYYVESKTIQNQRYTLNPPSKKIFEIKDNDFIQTGGEGLTQDNEETTLSNAIIDEILSKYAQGVECVTLQCSISDYYDYEGELKISKDTVGKRHFKIYDIVTPYVIRKGVEVPYSTYEDGSPKKFQVLGIKYHSVGIPWQDLVLQELIQ